MTQERCVDYRPILPLYLPLFLFAPFYLPLSLFRLYFPLVIYLTSTTYTLFEYKCHITKYSIDWQSFLSICGLSKLYKNQRDIMIGNVFLRMLNRQEQ